MPRLYRKHDWPYFYYTKGFIKNSNREFVWVKLVPEEPAGKLVCTSDGIILFGIEEGPYHDKKFNNKVRRIIKALLERPDAFKLPTIISPKDINENCNEIIKYIKGGLDT